MIRNPAFWQLEKEAPLLSRNHDFLKDGDNSAVFARVAKWPELVGVDAAAQITPQDTIARALEIMRENKVRYCFSARRAWSSSPRISPAAHMPWNARHRAGPPFLKNPCIYGTHQVLACLNSFSPPPLSLSLAQKATSLTVFDKEKNENVAVVQSLGVIAKREENPYDEEFDRIAIKDAQRTFRSLENRQQMIGMSVRSRAMALCERKTLRVGGQR